MAVDIGPKIGIQGETEFRKELEKVSQGVKTLGSEMKIVTAEFGKNAQSEEALTKKNDVLERSVLTLKEKLDLQNEALVYAAKNYGEADTRTLKWQQAVNETEATLAKAEREIDKNNSALEDLGENEDDAGKKGTNMGKAIKAAAEVGKVALEATAAAAVAIGAAAITAGKKLWDMSKETAAMGDEIDKNSQKVGLSVEAYQKWDYAMKISGTEMSAATTGLKTLTNKFDDAKNGSKSAVAQFERLGLSMDEISGLSREELFETVVKSIQNVTDETEKAAIANDFFGKSGQDLMPMFNMTESELDGLMNKAEEYGMVMSEEGVKASADFQDSLTTLEGTFTGFKNSITTELLPSLTMVTDGLASLLNGDESAGEQIAAGFSGIIQSLTDKLPELTNLLALIAGVVAEQAPAILNALMQGILSALPTLIPIAVNVIMTLIQGMVSMLPQILASGIQLLQALMKGIAEALPELIPIAIETTMTLADTLTDPENLGQMVDSALQLIMSLADGLIAALPEIAAKAPEIVTNLVTAITENLPKILEAGVTLVVELAKGLIKAIPELVKAIPQLIQALVLGFLNLGEKIVGIGVNIVNGIKQGIVNAWTNFTSWVSGLFDGLVGGIKKLLHINSPSKVFAEIGGSMVEGLEYGWDKDFGALQSDIDASMASLVPTSTANIGVVSSMRGTGMQSSVADAVNAMGTLMSGNGNGGDLAIQFIINGREFARGILPDFRLVSAQNPIIVNDF